MKCSSLSEKDIPKIEEILKRKKVVYSIGVDKDVKSANDQSMHNDLRHFNGATLSSDILCIDIQNEQLTLLSIEDKKELEGFNIFLDVEVPDFKEEELNENPDLSPDKLIVEQSRKLLGRFSQIEIGMVILVLALIGLVALAYKN